MKERKKTKITSGLDHLSLNSADKLFFENRIEREWLSTKEAAHYLRVSQDALRIMVHRDKIPAYKLGSRLRFRVADCQALFEPKGV